MSPPASRKKNAFTFEEKKAIIEKIERGVKQNHVAKEYGIARSTIHSIWMAKDEILAEVKKASKGIKRIENPRLRHPLLNEMEKLLMVWIKDLEMQGKPTSMPQIQQKARKIFDSLAKDHPDFQNRDASHEEDEGEGKANKGKIKYFKASKGWFDRFRMRNNLKNTNLAGEAGSAGKKASNVVEEASKDVIKVGGKRKRRILTPDEMPFFAKSWPVRRTYVVMKEDSMPAWKTMPKDPVKNKVLDVTKTPVISKRKPTRTYVVRKENTMPEGKMTKDVVKDKHLNVNEIPSPSKKIPMTTYITKKENTKPDEKMVEEHRPLMEFADLLDVVVKEEANEAPVQVVEDERATPLTSAEIKDILKQWEEVRRFFITQSPDQLLVKEAAEAFDDVVVLPFRAMLKKTKKQSTITSFFSRRPGPSSAGPGPSGTQRKGVSPLKKRRVF